MQIESVPEVRQNALSTPRFTTLIPLIVSFSMLYGEALQAQSPLPKKASSTIKQTKGFEELAAAIRDAEPQLDNPSYNVREAAQLQIHTAIRYALEHRNPLPLSTRALLEHREKTHDGTMETYKRMQGARLFLEDMERALPGRIAAPDEEHPLSALLEEQFHCRITATADIAPLLQNYRQGAEGDEVGASFLRLCSDLHVIPLATTDGFFLRRAEEGESFRLEKNVGMITVRKGETRHREVFLLPDKEKILTLVSFCSTSTGEDVQLLQDPFGEEDDLLPTSLMRGMQTTWTHGEGQNTPQSQRDLPPMHNRFLAMVASYPMTTELCLDRKKNACGMQCLCASDAEREQDGTWKIGVEGTIWEGVEWPKTKNEEDMFSYELVAANRIEGIGVNGKTIPVTVSPLHICQREFSFTVHCAERPAKLRIRTFAEIEERLIRVPKH